jgi:hypothetical protein
MSLPVGEALRGIATWLDDEPSATELFDVVAEDLSLRIVDVVIEGVAGVGDLEPSGHRPSFRALFEIRATQRLAKGRVDHIVNRVRARGLGAVFTAQRRPAA